MTHDRKVETYKSMMKAAGVSAATSVPPLWRLLWAAGSTLPPPPFMGFLPLALLTGGLFGVLFPAMLWALSQWGLTSTSPAELAMVGPLAGAFFGLSMAVYYRSLARTHRLGRWSDFPHTGMRT